MAGCYSPPQPACGFLCGPAGACPADYTCLSDQRCHLNSAPVTACDGDGGIPTRDAAMVDTPFGIEGIVLLDADVTGPTVFTSPGDGQTGVPTTAIVIATFNEPVMNVLPTTFNLTQSGSLVTTNLSEQTPTQYSLVPTFPLMTGTTYTVTLQPIITDFSGNSLPQTTVSFTTLP